MKKITSCLVLFLAVNYSSAQIYKQNKQKLGKNMNIRVLFESDQCGFEDPFLFVARDEKTLLLLPLKLNQKIDFSKEAIIAVFAGTKPTPGYEIELTVSNGFASVKVKNPPKDAILPQVLTNPCKIFAVKIEEEKPIYLKSSILKTTEYTVQGSIGYSGGFAPRQKTYQVGGKILAIKSENLVTLNLEIRAKNNPSIKIFETVSGKIENGKIYLNRVDPNNFSELPRPMMKAFGTFSEKNISLKFEPNPTIIVSDGFEAEGFIEATRK